MKTPTREADKATAVRRMFGGIAPRYDLLNHLLSLNLDRVWRRRAVALLRSGSGGQGVKGSGGTAAPVFLDACAGTLDLSVALAEAGLAGRVVASDFSFPMLAAGARKASGRPIAVVCGDALLQPFPAASFDGAIVGFGVRNLADIDAGFREFARLLKPGAKLVVLDFMTPNWQPFRGIYLLYFKRILPLIGRLISGHNSAYSYLPASVLEFPEPPELAARMRTAGFGDVRWEAYSGGIVAAHVGTRI